MKRTIAAAAIAGTLLTGVAVGSTALGPISAIAQSDSGDEGGEAARPRHTWLEDAINKLVDDGTINRAQGDAVLAAIRDHRPEHPRHRPPGPRAGLAKAAEVLGMEEQALAEALHGGKTLAEVAAEHNVDVDSLVDALVAAAEAHLAGAVENGRLTQEKADEVAAGLRERITARVNGEGPGPRPEGRRPGLGFGPRGGAEGGDQDTPTAA